jgi:hypothetical protein
LWHKTRGDIKLSVYDFPEFLPGLKKRHLLGGDLDRVAGFGIAPFAGVAASGSETAEASQLDFVALFQGVSNTCEQNVDDGFGLLLGKVNFVGNSSRKLCFCHVSSLTEGKHLMEGVSRLRFTIATPVMPRHKEQKGPLQPSA